MLILRSTLATASVIGLAFLPAQAARADDAQVSKVVITAPGDSSSRASLTLTLDAPTSVSDIEADLGKTLASEPAQVDGGTLTIEAPVGQVMGTRQTPGHSTQPPTPRGSYGSNLIYCQVSYEFRDFNGVFGTQRQCGVRSAPWYFQLSPDWQTSVVGGVNERGLKWWWNGHERPMQAPHPGAIPAYIFHGAFNDTGSGDFIYWEDVLTWRHNIGSGGNAELDIWGSLTYKGMG